MSSKPKLVSLLSMLKLEVKSIDISVLDEDDELNSYDTSESDASISS
jgi:hypothetical protein